MKNKLVANICREGGNTLKFYCSLIVAVLSMTTFSDVKKYYVSTSGSDQNDGSANSPFATLNFALSSADSAIATGEGSATIYVADGTYDISEDESHLNLTNAISVIGNTGDPSQVVILNNSTKHRSFYLNHNSAAIKGITIDRTSAESLVGVTSGGHINLANGLIEDCVIRGGKLGSSVEVTDNQLGGNVYMTGGRISRSKILDGRALLQKTGDKYGLWAMGNIYVYGAVSGSLPVLENCLIANGYAQGVKNSTTTAPRKTGNIGITGSCHVINSTIVNGSSSSGIGGITLFNDDNFTDTKIINCVMIGNDGIPSYSSNCHKDWGIGQSNYPGETTKRLNNSFINCASGLWSEKSGTKTYASIAPNATCIEITKDAFENFSAGDYRPRKKDPVSPLINAGTSRTEYLKYASSTTDLNGSSRFFGKLDIGCYECSLGGFSVIVR
jgi:hypothetical protein